VEGSSAKPPIGTEEGESFTTYLDCHGEAKQSIVSAIGEARTLANFAGAR
jgi:hypothetical protein